MKTKYTNRPWAISKIGNDYDQYMVYSETENPSKNIVNSVEGKANAELISAAPDLIEACQLLEDRLGNLIESGRIEWTVDDAPLIHGELEEARGAISKALGE